MGTIYQHQESCVGSHTIIITDKKKKQIYTKQTENEINKQIFAHAFPYQVTHAHKALIDKFKLGKKKEMWSRFDALRAQLWVHVWVGRRKEEKKRILNYMNCRRALTIIGAAWKFPTTFIIIWHEIDVTRGSSGVRKKYGRGKGSVLVVSVESIT